MKAAKIILIIILTTINIFSQQQWFQTSGPEGGNIRDIKNYNGYLFAACAPGGIYRSSDNGVTWLYKSGGISYGYNNIHSITFCNGVLYAGGYPFIKSTNNGDNWTYINSFTNTVYTMVPIGTKVLVGTSNGLYISTDNGNTWIESNTGLDNRYLLTLKVNSNKIYAGTLGGGIYVSNDSGSSWTSINNGLTNLFINDIEVYNGNLFAATSYDRVFKSTNNGANWFYSGSGITYPNVNSLTVHNNNIYAGNYGGGIFVSVNGGASWISVSGGLPPDAIPYALESFNNVLYSGLFGDGVFRSTNNGNNWLSLNTGLIASGVPQMIRTAAGVFAASIKRVFLSTDNGSTWNVRSNGLSCNYLSSMAVNNNDIYTGSGGCGVFLSTNNGLNWTNVNNGLPSVINCLDANGAYVFAGTYNGVYYTTNRGLQWFAANNGLMDSSIFSIICIPGQVFISNSDGIYKTTNNGIQWIDVSSGLPEFTYANNFCYYNSNIYAATSEGVFVSTNSGGSWEQRTAGLPNTYTFDIIGTGNFMFVSSYSFGIYYSSNSGLNWYPYKTGFNTIPISFCVLDSVVLAGSYDRGVFKTSKNIIGVKNISIEVPGYFILYQNYPNPFNPDTKIYFDIPLRGFTTLKIYDVQGKKISTLVNQQLQPGKYEAEWDGTNYPSGLYFYVLSGENYSDAKKMILIK